MRNSLSRQKAPTGTPAICKISPPGGWPTPPEFPSKLLAHFSWKPNTPPLTNPQVDLEIPRIGDTGNYYIQAMIAGTHWIAALNYAGWNALHTHYVWAADNLAREIYALAIPFQIPKYPAQAIAPNYYLLNPPGAEFTGLITHP